MLEEIENLVNKKKRTACGKLWYCFYVLCESNAFSIVMNTSIILNSVIMAMNRYPISNEEQSFLTYSNYFFYFLFLVEMIVKQIGLGLKGYFVDRFNQFDCLIVIISTIDILN